MTGRDMVYNFQQLLQTTSKAFESKERLDTYEILDYINRTIDRYIKTKYFSGASFIDNSSRVKSFSDDLKELITTTPIAPVITFSIIDGMSIAYSSDLPSDFFGYVRSDSKITRVNVLPCAGQWVPNQEIEYSKVDEFSTTPFNKPIIEKPLVTFKDDEELITIIDVYTTLDNNMITYVKTPTEVDMSNNDCQLAPYLHEEIVRLAVSMYLDEYKMRLNQPRKQDTNE